MAQAKSFTYADSGVDIEKADRAKNKIKRLAEQTFNRSVLTGIGSFGAAYALSHIGLRRPVLVSSADGVGTKLKVAFAAGVHDTVGQDLVNHCVNDIAVQGAKPLFFLDYFATGKLSPPVTEQVIRGLAVACKQNGCALIGGETAEMPSLYQPGEYDLAGFIVGAADRPQLVDVRRVRQGDILLGLPSTGLHTNGYSLARKLLFEVAGYEPHTTVKELGGTVAKELLKIHRSYLKPLRALLEDRHLHAAAHITGGGITGNTPRMLPPDLCARIRIGSWPVPPIFALLEKLGNVAPPEMMRTFNMGVGLIVAVPARSKNVALRLLKKLDEPVYEIGRVAAGRRRVIYE